MTSPLVKPVFGYISLSMFVTGTGVPLTSSWAGLGMASSCSLADHICGAFILAETQEDRMSEHSIMRPLRERHLADEFRAHPVGAFECGRRPIFTRRVR